MTSELDEERRRAIRGLLMILRQPLMLMCIPDREAALAAAKKHAITAEDLIRYAIEQARS